MRRSAQSIKAESKPDDASKSKEPREMQLHEIRKSRRQSQSELAAKLGVKQGEVSKIENRRDMYVSTLRNYVNALGGDLEVVATFSNERPVFISQFDEVPKGKEANSADQTEAHRITEESPGGMGSEIERATPQEASRTLRRKGLESLWFWSIVNTEQAPSGVLDAPRSTRPIKDDWYTELLQKQSD